MRAKEFGRFFSVLLEVILLEVSLVLCSQLHLEQKLKYSSFKSFSHYK